MQYGQPQQLTMELMANQPLQQMMRYTQPPFIPQVSYPMVMQNDIPFITLMTMNAIVNRAQQHAARMFLFNQMSMNGWNNPDFAELMEVVINNAAAWLMGGQQFSRVEDWANEAIEPLVTERMCDNVKYWPMLLQLVDGHTASAINNNLHAFQGRRQEVLRFAQHTGFQLMFVGMYNPAQAVQLYPSQYAQPGTYPQPSNPYQQPPAMGMAYAQGRPINTPGVSVTGHQRPMTSYGQPSSGTGGLFVQDGPAQRQPMYQPMQQPMSAMGEPSGQMDRYTRQLLKQQGKMPGQAPATTVQAPRYGQPQGGAPMQPAPGDNAMSAGGWKNMPLSDTQVVSGVNPFSRNATTVADLGRGVRSAIGGGGFSTTPEAAARTQAEANQGRGPAISRPVAGHQPTHLQGDLTPLEMRALRMMPKGWQKDGFIGDIIPAPAGCVFTDNVRGKTLLADHCILGINEDGLMQGYLPQTIQLENLTSDPDLPPFRADPNQQRTREDYDNYIYKLQCSKKTPQEAHVIIHSERHRLHELEARIAVDSGQFAHNFVPEAVLQPQAVEQDQPLVTPAQLTAAQRNLLERIQHEPKLEKVFHLVDQYGVPTIVEPGGDVAWSPSDAQPYPPAYPMRTHMLQYLVFANGTVYADVVQRPETQKDKPMDYESHHIGAVPSQASDRVPDPAPLPTVAATPEPESQGVKIDFRDKESINLSDNDAMAEATLRAFFKDRVIGLTSGVRSVQTVAHPLVCADAMTAGFYREFLERVAKASDVEEIGKMVKTELVKPEHMLLRNHLEDVLTERVNDALANNVRLGYNISSFSDDIADLIEALRADPEVGSRIAGVFKTNLLGSVKDCVGMLAEGTAKEFMESYIDNFEGDSGYPQRVVFVTRRVGITHLGIGYQDLQFTAGPTTGVFQISENLPVLHEVAEQLFDSDTKLEDDLATQYVILRDGVKLALYRGWLGTDFYLARVVRFVS